MSFYLEQLAECLPKLPRIRYWVGDGSYAKTEFFNYLTARGRQLITRLRADANLHYLWTQGHPPGQRGSPRRYDGKVHFEDLARW